MGCLAKGFNGSQKRDRPLSVWHLTRSQKSEAVVVVVVVLVVVVVVLLVVVVVVVVVVMPASGC